MDIEKSVPIPKTTGKGRKESYPFSKMEMGDSILVDGMAADPRHCPAYGAATQHGRNHGKKFTGRKTEPGKVRIWRIE